MIKEVFRASNICVPDHREHDLELLNLSLYKGEVLGIWGNYRAGKSKLFDVITGDAQPTSGAVFWDGKPPAMVKINIESIMIQELAVWENLAILWGGHIAAEPLRRSRLKRMASLLLEDYEVAIDINRKTSTLSRVERLMLEMIMGSRRRARLMLLDLAGINGTMQEYKPMKALLTKLKQEGMSVIVFSHQMQEVTLLSDRVGVLYDGRIIKLVDQSVVTQEVLSKLGTVMYQDTKPLEKKQRARDERILQIEQLDAGLRSPVSIALERGEFMAVISPHTDLFQILVRRIADGEQEKTCQVVYKSKKIKRIDGESGILFLNMPQLDQLIEEMTPLENLCLGITKKAGFWGMERRSIIRCIEQDFYEWYGHKGLLQQKDCRMLCLKDRVAINLFRIRFQNQAVIFCDDVSIHNDLSIYNMIREELAALAETGVAVCMVTSDLMYSDELIERYVILDHRKSGAALDHGAPDNGRR